MKHILPKSIFLRGLKCHKALYLNKYNKELRDEISIQQQTVFDRGINVGILAQDLFPGGVDCTPESLYDLQQAVLNTKKAIANGAEIIYEAAFQFEGVLALLDILVKDGGGGKNWKAWI